MDLSLEKFFPKQWTHFSQIDWMPLLFGLKLAGYDWKELNDVAKICAFMERANIIQRNGEGCIRLNPDYHKKAPQLVDGAKESKGYFQ